MGCTELALMPGRPDRDDREEVFTEKEIKELRRGLSLLSASSVMDFYRDAWKECAAERRPGARAMQQLVTAWKILRRWRWE
jgi:hypothetical protein